MKITITKIQALRIMLALITAVIAFHVLVLLQVIPHTIVWAGKFSTFEEARLFEVISILVNVALLVLLLVKGYHLRTNRVVKVVDVMLWVFVVLFAINTIGNIFAVTLAEKLLFTPLTFISAVLIWIIVRKKKAE